MSHITCMLCGLQRPLKNYDPAHYENEIYQITKIGKRSGGFNDTFEPILGDDVITPIVKNRILDIVRAFIEKGIVSEKELAELIPKKDVGESFMNKAISSILYNILTGSGEDRKIKDFESEKRELLKHVEKLKTDYNKLDVEYKKTARKYIESNSDFINQITWKDLLDYALIHFIKYCDSAIGGLTIIDYKVLLMSLDQDSSSLLGCFYQDLTVEEWCSLMDKIQGPLQVQAFLDYFTMLKKDEAIREYNKMNLFNNLMMFRLLKLSSSN